MIHGNGAREIQNISSLRHATHLLTSHPAWHPRHHIRMLIHVRRAPFRCSFNLSSLRPKHRGGARLGGGVTHPGDREGIYMRSAHPYPTGQNSQIDFKLEPLL